MGTTVKTNARVGLGRLAISRVGFAPNDSRPTYGVSDYGPRYAYVEDNRLVIYYSEEETVAGQLNLEIEQGATFAYTFWWKNRDGSAIDLTGAIVKMQIREEKAVSAEHVASISSVAAGPGDPTPWFDAIDVTPLEGKIEVYLTPANTTQIVAGNWWYDILIYLGVEVHRLVEGRVLVDAGVTS